MVFRLFSRLIGALRIRHYGSTRIESTNQNDVEAIDDLPLTCLRGLRKKDWVVNGLVATEAFLPEPKTAEKRTDRGLETSVNWEDKSSVLDFTLADQTIAQYGVARVLTAEIKHLSRMTIAVTMPLLCERRPEDKNPYHGNIVYSAATPRLLQKQLAAALATKSRFIPQSDQLHASC